MFVFIFGKLYVLPWGHYSFGLLYNNVDVYYLAICWKLLRAYYTRY